MLLTALRLLTLVGYAAVIGGLMAVRRSVGSSGEPGAGRAWARLVWPYGLIAFNVVLFEIQGLAFPPAAEGSQTEFLQDLLYNEIYLTQAVAGAFVPVVLLTSLPKAVGWRRAAFVAGVAIAGGLLAAVATGALSQWTTLLSWTRVIYLVAIAGHLLFWALLALGALRPVGRHLAAFVGIETVFALLVPAQEAVFAALGRADAGRIWYVTQLVQAVSALGQAAVVLGFLRSGRQVPRPGVATGDSATTGRI